MRYSDTSENERKLRDDWNLSPLLGWEWAEGKGEKSGSLENVCWSCEIMSHSLLGSPFSAFDVGVLDRSRATLCLAISFILPGHDITCLEASLFTTRLFIAHLPHISFVCLRFAETVKISLSFAINWRPQGWRNECSIAKQQLLCHFLSDSRSLVIKQSSHFTCGGEISSEFKSSSS